MAPPARTIQHRAAFVALPDNESFLFPSPRKNMNSPMTGGADGGHWMPWPGAGDKAGDKEGVSDSRAGAESS